MSTDGVATWPGCCCEEPGCGPLCLMIREGTNLSSSPSSGSSVNGGALGTVTTGADGKACFDISGPGSYTFTVTKAGYRTEQFTFTVAEGDCGSGEIIKSPPELVPSILPANCYSYKVVKCSRCAWAGATVNLYYTYLGVAYVMHFTSRYDGFIFVCFPPGHSGATLEFELIGNGSNQFTTRPAHLDLILPGTDEYIGELSANYNKAYWCYPQFGCESAKPLSLTFSVAGGRTYVLAYDAAADSWFSPFQPAGAGQTVNAAIFGYGNMATDCGPEQNWFVDERLFNGDGSFAGLIRWEGMTTGQPAGFSLYCPVNVKMMKYVGTTGFPTINAYLSE